MRSRVKESEGIRVWKRGGKDEGSRLKGRIVEAITRYGNKVKVSTEK